MTPDRQARIKETSEAAFERPETGGRASATLRRAGVDVQTGPAFSAGTPRLLFEQPGSGRSNPIRTWDVSLDGQRFLMVKLDDRKRTPVTEMILVQNWFEELKRLASAGNK